MYSQIRTSPHSSTVCPELWTHSTCECQLSEASKLRKLTSKNTSTSSLQRREVSLEHQISTRPGIQRTFCKWKDPWLFRNRDQQWMLALITSIRHRHRLQRMQEELNKNWMSTEMNLYKKPKRRLWWTTFVTPTSNLTLTKEAQMNSESVIERLISIGCQLGIEHCLCSRLVR